MKSNQKNKPNEELDPLIIKGRHLELLGLKGYKKPKGTVFTNFQPEYKLDEKTNELVPTGSKIDIQEKIQSNAHVALDKVYDKFMSGESVTAFNDRMGSENVMFDTTEINPDKLIGLGELIEKADNFREEYNLDPNLSTEKVFRKVADIALANQDKLNKQMEILAAKKLLAEEKAAKKLAEKVGKENAQKVE